MINADNKTYWSHPRIRFMQPELFYERIDLVRSINESDEPGNVGIPRFTLKHKGVFPDMPANKPVPYSDELIIRCIEYGMVVTILYKGAKDRWKGGRERVVYPMVLGRSSQGRPLLRGWHLTGWSISNSGNAEKIWRMFRADRIKSITFTGTFFRMPPAGYVAQDSGMRGGIIAAANLDAIKRRQLALLYSGRINQEDDVKITGRIGVRTFSVKNTNSVLDLADTMSNPVVKGIFNKSMDKSKLRVVVLRSQQGKSLAIIGVLGEVGKTVQLYEDRLQLGSFQVRFSGNFENLPKSVHGKSEYSLYTT